MISGSKIYAVQTVVVNILCYPNQAGKSEVMGASSVS